MTWSSSKPASNICCCNSGILSSLNIKHSFDQPFMCPFHVFSSIVNLQTLPPWMSTLTMCHTLVAPFFPFKHTILHPSHCHCVRFPHLPNESLNWPTISPFRTHLAPITSFYTLAVFTSSYLSTLSHRPPPTHTQHNLPLYRQPLLHLMLSFLAHTISMTPSPPNNNNEDFPSKKNINEDEWDPLVSTLSPIVLSHVRVEIWVSETNMLPNVSRIIAILHTI